MSLNRATRRDIPSFSLYGERSDDVSPTGPLHIEDIQSRSRKYLWKIGTHRHARSCQCVFVAAGPVSVDLEESRAELEGPAVVLVPAGTVHGFGFRSDSLGYVLTLNLDHLLELASPSQQTQIAALFSSPRALTLSADRPLAARIAPLFATLLQEFRQPDTAGAPVCAWLACATLWVLASTVLAPAAGCPAAHGDLDRLRRFRAAVETHYLSHWPVARYARRLAISESSLNRLCRDAAGCTAFELIQQRLVLEARRRLVYVAGPVAGIAAQLGFKDAAYFCRFFRKHAAMSPGAFRRRHGGG